MSIFRFGIAGAGAIARRFADGLSQRSDITLGAVASQTKGSAGAFVKEFSDRFPRARAYDSYAQMAEDPEIDAVYVANLNTQHADTVKLFLTAHKPVICEKPFALNAVQAEEMVFCAKENNVFLMEAMWTRFLPVTHKAMEWIREGKIGEPTRIYSDFGMCLMTEESRRTVSLEKGGGALLDLGVYPISFFGMIFGYEPDQVTSNVTKADTGVDSSFEVIFRYPERERAFGNDAPTACALVSIDNLLPNTMRIVGDEGFIEIRDFWMGRSTAFYSKDAEGFFQTVPSEVFEADPLVNGYQYEAVEVASCVRVGKKESSVMTHSDTIAVMKIMDHLRAQWGIRFPQES